MPLKLSIAFSTTGMWALESKLLYLSEGNKGRIERFTSKAFLSILQSDQILSLYLVHKLVRAVAITNITAKEINCLKVEFIPYNSLDMCVVIFSKWVNVYTKMLESVS